MCSALRFDLRHTTDELSKVWSDEYQLMEEDYLQTVEERGVDLGHEVFQIFADPFEIQLGEKGEESACQWR